MRLEVSVPVLFVVSALSSRLRTSSAPEPPPTVSAAVMKSSLPPVFDSRFSLAFDPTRTLSKPRPPSTRSAALMLRAAKRSSPSSR
jgi:hypothetical protein